jgi:hypothetical protein
MTTIGDENVNATFGVKCEECSLAKQVSDAPPLYMDEDERLKNFFSCPKKPKWKWFHKDLVHPCPDVVPTVDRTYPLPSRERVLMLEQAAADPRNEVISASAMANRLFTSMPRHLAYKEIQSITESNPRFGRYVENLFEEIVVRSSLTKKSARPR